jgi:hypothetical protein
VGEERKVQDEEGEDGVGVEEMHVGVRLSSRWF